MKIVALMNRAFAGELPLLPSGEDYWIAMEETGRQAIAGQVHHELQARGCLEHLPDDFLSFLQARRREQSLYNLILKAEADRVLFVLERRGIRTIVLKGTWLSRRLYGSDGVRGTSDIDLLVAREDLPAACERICAELGYAGMPYDPNSPYHAELVRTLPGRNLEFRVELHWNLVKPDFFRLDCRPMWERAQRLPDYGSVFELSEPDLFYTLCLHGAKHGMSSLRNVLDLEAMLRVFADRIDYNELFRRARREETYGMVVMALSVAYRLFPHLHAVKPFEACRTWFPWNQRLAWKREAGYRRYQGGMTYYVQRTVFELAKFDRNRYRYRYLYGLLFPKRAAAKSKRRIFQKG